MSVFACVHAFIGREVWFSTAHVFLIIFPVLEFQSSILEINLN